MKKLTVLAAAFAAGVTSFTARAEDISLHAEKTAALQATMRAEAQETKAAAVAGQGKVKKATGAKAAGKAERGKVRVARSSKPVRVAAAERAHGKRVRIDLMAGRQENERPVAVAAKAGPSGSHYTQIVAHYASTYGVPASLAHAVIRIESNYRAGAHGSAGEVGLMQIKPATARMMGYSGSTKGLYNPDTNIKFGMKYLAMAQQLGGGTTCGTILKYNAGHAATRMNPVSSAYCSEVKRHLAGA